MQRQPLYTAATVSAANEPMIPLSETTLGEEEAQAAADVVRSGWLTQGERVAHFERSFAAMVGTKHAIAVANCTLALELALDAVGVRPGDEVIVPALTFVATANAARRLGAIPVFADVTSEDDLTMSPADVARKRTAKTKAICPVHYAGYAADIDGIRAAAPGVAIIEDSAHAPGATLGAKQCGALGDVGVFSFFSNKNMTTGEGGMLTTDDDSLAATLRLSRAHGMTTSTLDRHRGHAFTYDVARVGTNARMDEIRAAIGTIQLRKLVAANAHRAQCTEWYRALLANVDGLQVPFAKHSRGASSHHLFVVLLPPAVDRSKVMASLRAQGVQSSIHYPPTHRFTAYQGQPSDVAITDRVASRILTLPLFSTMTRAQVERVCTALQNALRAASSDPGSFADQPA
jgi:dTDP-4-amino-4,6-dideoxygalactose transaminase